MGYHFSTTVGLSFEAALDKVQAGLPREGFGLLSEIDVQATLKRKLDADLRPRQILGARNLPLAQKGLHQERRIGARPPCRVVVQRVEAGVEVAASDPVVSMAGIDNPEPRGHASVGCYRSVAGRW